MDFKKAGRPKASKEEKRDKKILLKLTVAEYDALQNKAQGFISVSDFIRTRIFYNSTFQQVQPEEFIKILKQYLDILAETKAAMSESLSEIKRHINPGVAGMNSKAPIPRFPMKDSLSTGVSLRLGIWFCDTHWSNTMLPHRSGNESAKNGGRP